jgi:O-antigen ligase
MHMMPRREGRSNTAQGYLKQATDIALYAFVIFSVISISATQAAYIVALMAWGCSLYLNRERKLQPRFPMLVPICAFALASALATATAVESYRSLIELRNVFEIGLFFLVVNHVTREEQATSLTRVLVWVGTLMALYGLVQSVTHGTAFRIHGAFGYMTFANVLTLIHVMAFAHLLFNDRNRHRLWYIPALILLTAAILMTHTRGAWLGLVTGVAVVLGCHAAKRLLLFLPLMIVVAFLLAPHAVKDRIRSILDGQDATIQMRLCKWRIGANLIRAYPLTGVGMNGIKTVYLDYKAPADPVACGDRRLGHLDNNLVQIAVERGLIGVACWLWIWGSYLRRWWLIYDGMAPQNGQAKALVVGSLASVTGFHVTGLFEYTFGDSEVIMLVYFLMALPFVTQPLASTRPQ